MLLSAVQEERQRGKEKGEGEVESKGLPCVLLLSAVQEERQRGKEKGEGEVESKGFTLSFVVVSRTGGETEG